MIDTHCHIIPKFEYTNPKEIIDNAMSAGVNKMICIGCDFIDMNQSIQLVNDFPGIVYTAIGLHPETVQFNTNIDEHWNKFDDFFKRNIKDIFAIGECGLDFHYSNDLIIKDKQIDLFKRHIKLSIEFNKPLIIHTRDAWDETFKIFDELDIRNLKNQHHIIKDEGTFPNMDIDLTSGILHSFTGGIDEAKRCIDLNFKLGVNGIITFKNKSLDSLREAIIFAGKENIVFETDSPFLSPEPFRGKTNQPSRIKEISEYVSNLINK